MITIEQLKDVQQRADKLKAYLAKFLNTNEDFYQAPQRPAAKVYMFPTEDGDMSLAAESDM